MIGKQWAAEEAGAAAAEAMMRTPDGGPLTVNTSEPHSLASLNDLESGSLASSNLDTVDSSAPQSYTWRDVRCSYEQRSPARGDKPVEVEVLHGVDGHLKTGQMLAVIGPSGSGKTCLLDILAERKTIGKISGLRLLDGQVASRRRFQRVTAYVTQEDTFHPTSTVKEAVLFQANLRLDRSMSALAKNALALRLIEDVGLKGKENTYVGGPLPGGLRVRGLSGGEKRRLSLCCGTFTAPSLLFLDEPTSGLDSFAALVVMRLIKKYCQRGMMVMCTIHQPRAAIWNLFEKVMVLSMGHQVYFGDASGAEAWFASSLGYPRHHSTSAVDFIMDLVNVSFAKDPEVFSSRTMQKPQDLEEAAAQFRALHPIAGPSEPLLPPARVSRTTSLFTIGDSLYNDDRSLLDRLTGAVEAAQTWFWQFRVVLGRNAINYYRNPGNVLARVTVMLVIAGLEALVYFRIGSREAGSTSLLTVVHIMGSIFYSILAVTLLPFASLSLFIYDRQFYSGEAASKLYKPSAYFLANIVLETALNSFNGLLYALIVYFNLDYATFTRPESVAANFMVYMAGLVLQTNMGSMCVQFSALIAPNQDIAFVLAAGYVAASILTGGFIVSFPMFFHYAKWLQYISFIKFTFQGMTQNALRGTQIESVIDTIAINTPPSVSANLLCGLGIYSALTLGAYLALRHLHKEKR